MSATSEIKAPSRPTAIANAAASGFGTESTITKPAKRPTARPPLPTGHDDVALADIKDLEALTRMKKSWIYQAVREGRFPAPVIREPRCTRWALAQARAWLAARIEQAAADTDSAAIVTERAQKASAAAQAKRVNKKSAAATAA